MIENVLETVRVINLVWACVLFVFMMFYGVLDIFLTQQCDTVHVDPESRYWALSTTFGTLSLVVSVAEILLQGNGGLVGIRVLTPIPFLLFASLGAMWGRMRVVGHKASIKSGQCGKAPHNHV